MSWSTGRGDNLHAARNENKKLYAQIDCDVFDQALNEMTHEMLWNAFFYLVAFLKIFFN